MLPKAHRLTRESDFKKIAKEAKSVHSRLFLLKKLSSLEKQTKFGIVISTKVSKKATIRNKVKRQTREIIHLNLPQIKPNYKVVIIVKNNIVDKDYQEIEKDLESILKKAKLI